MSRGSGVFVVVLTSPGNQSITGLSFFSLPFLILLEEPQASANTLENTQQTTGTETHTHTHAHLPTVKCQDKKNVILKKSSNPMEPEKNNKLITSVISLP